MRSRFLALALVAACGDGAVAPDAGPEDAQAGGDPAQCDRACTRLYDECGLGLQNSGGALTKADCLDDCHAGKFGGLEFCFSAIECDPNAVAECLGQPPVNPPMRCIPCEGIANSASQQCDVARGSCRGQSGDCADRWASCNIDAFGLQATCYEAECSNMEARDAIRCMGQCHQPIGLCLGQADGEASRCQGCSGPGGVCSEICRARTLDEAEQNCRSGLSTCFLSCLR